MNLLTRVTILLVFVFLITYSIDRETALAVETNKTKNTNVRWVTDSLDKHLLSIEIVGKDVRVVSDGQYFKTNDKQNVFVLKPGDSFERSPDHHSSLSLRFISADFKLAKFSYEVKFDQRSFGRDQIDIDTGEVEISLRSSGHSTAAGDSPTAYLNLIKNRLAENGFQIRSSNKANFADQEFLISHFSNVGAKPDPKGSIQLPLELMIKVSDTDANCKEVVTKLSKMLKGQKSNNSSFDDYYNFPFGTYMGKRAIFRKGKALFVIVFYNEAQRKLLQESCFACVK